MASRRRLQGAEPLDQLGDSTEQPVIQEGLASTLGVDGFSECRTPCPGLRRDLIVFFFLIFTSVLFHGE